MAVPNPSVRRQLFKIFYRNDICRELVMYQSDVNIASSYALHSVCGYGFKNIYTICNAVCMGKDMH